MPPHRLRGIPRDRILTIGALMVLAAVTVLGGALVGAQTERTAGPAAGSEGGGLGAREPGRSSFLAQMIPPPAEQPEASAEKPSSVEELVSRLPLERKVAQLFLLGFEGDDKRSPLFEDLEDRDIGGVVFSERNYRKPKQIEQLASEIAATANSERHVAPLLLARQAGGDDSAFADLPPKLPPARIKSAGEAGRVMQMTAEALDGIGLSGVLGPTIDIGAVGGPIGEAAFSDDVEQVVLYARAVVEAAEKAGIVSAPGRFPGLGAASQEPDRGPATVGLGLDELKLRDLLPFEAAIEVGAPAMVVGPGAYESDDFVTPASQSQELMVGLLRDELGFEGVAIAENLSSPAITSLGSIPDAAVASLIAGADMVEIAGPRGDQEAAYIAVLNAARRGAIPRERIDQALLRVLRLKRSVGLVK